MSAAGVDKTGMEYWADLDPDGFGALSLRESLDVPVIARVNGYALGGGMEMVLGCDIVVAAETAKFGLTEPRIGRLPLDGGMVRLPRQIPYHQAMGLLLTGRKAPAAEMYRLGLVNEVVPAADLDDAVQRWVDDVLACAPLSLKAIKQTVSAPRTSPRGRPTLCGCRAGRGTAEQGPGRGGARLPGEARAGMERIVTVDPGVWGVVATPFSGSTLDVDEGSLVKLVAHYESIGVTGLTVLGVFGEAAQLSSTERREVLEAAADTVALPLVVGATSLGTAPVIEESLLAVEAVGDRVAALMVQVNSPRPDDCRLICARCTRPPACRSSSRTTRRSAA